MKKLLTIILLAFCCMSGFSQQSKIDSLKKELTTASVDTVRMKHIVGLGYLYATINIDSSIFYAKQGVQLARSYGDDTRELISLTGLAIALSEHDIPQSMLVNYQRLQLAEKLNDPFAIAHCYRNMGLLHLYMGNGKLYIEYLQKAKDIYKSLGNKSLIAACDVEIGQTYLGRQPDFDSARHYLTLAMQDTAQLGSGFYLGYWGRLETDNDPPKARAYLYKSLQRFIETQNLRGIGLASRWFSTFYEKQGQLDSSIIVARTGLAASQQLNFYRGIIFNSSTLTSIYRKLNQTDSAYKYLSIMTDAKDSLLSQDKINQIQRTIIEEQERVQKLQAEKTSFSNRIKLYTSFAIVIALLLFVIFFYRSKRRIKASLDSLKATQKQLIQSEKMASLGELTAGIAHEIQNPLNFVNNFSEVNEELLVEMKEELDKGNIAEAKAIATDAIENQQKIIHHGKRADAIVKGMLQHSRSSSGQKEPTDINALCDEYLRLAYHGLRAKDKSFNASIKTDLDETIGNIHIIPQDIGRVILNLITNAFYVVDEKKKSGIEGYEPTVSVSTKKTGNKVLIAVKDNGNGIPQKVFDKIFQPFFTTKPTGQGTGLGLSLSYDIVKAHGGEIKVVTKENEGTEFIIQIPAKEN